MPHRMPTRSGPSSSCFVNPRSWLPLLYQNIELVLSSSPNPSRVLFATFARRVPIGPFVVPLCRFATGCAMPSNSWSTHLRSYGGVWNLCHLNFNPNRTLVCTFFVPERLPKEVRIKSTIMIRIKRASRVRRSRYAFTRRYPHPLVYRGAKSSGSDSGA